MDSKSNAPKILIIRSATRIMNQTLDALKREFPQSHITALVPESVRNNVAQDPLIDEVLTISNHRRMSVLNYGMKKIRDLRRRKFDLAVSLYNIDHGLGYSNIDFLAWASKAGNVRGYNARGTFVEISGFEVTKKIFLEKTTLVWSGINYLATTLLFAAITIGMILEWCFRKTVTRQTSSDNRNEAGYDKTILPPHQPEVMPSLQAIKNTTSTSADSDSTSHTRVLTQVE